MSLSLIRQKREARAKASADAQALIPQAGQPWTPEARQKFDGFMADADRLKVEIDDLERQARADSTDRELRDTQRPPEAQPGAAAATAAETRTSAIREYRLALRRYRSHQTASERIAPETRRIVNDLTDRWLRAFGNFLSPERCTSEDRAIVTGENPEFRDLGVGTSSLGGYTVPTGFVYQLEEAMKWYGGMLEAADIMDTATGQALPWPTDNDTTNTGELVGENQQVTKQDVTFGSLTFNAWKYSTKMVPISMELEQDSAFDLDAVIREKFAIRLGRILNAHFTTGLGSGSSQPNGIVTAVVANNGAAQVWGAGSGPGVPLVAAGSSANTGGGENGTNTIGSQDLVNLEHSLDKVYRRGAAYMMHDLTLRYIKNLLDKYGRPLWLPGLAVNAPDTINGYPYFTNNDMATLATANKTVLFGQLKKYKIRRVKELAILRLVERFADYGQIALIGFARYDGNLLDAGTKPVNYLKQA